MDYYVGSAESKLVHSTSIITINPSILEISYRLVDRLQDGFIFLVEDPQLRNLDNSSLCKLGGKPE